MSDHDDNMTSNRPYLLRAIYDWIVDNGCTPHVLVDAGVEGVRVPAQAVRDGQVVLNLDMQAIANLDLGDQRISFKARFSGVSHAVGFPVSAVLAIYAQENGKGMMFAEEGQGAPPPDTPPPDGSAPEDGDKGAASDKSGKREAPHLRVIK